MHQILLVGIPQIFSIAWPHYQDFNVLSAQERKCTSMKMLEVHALIIFDQVEKRSNQIDKGYIRSIRVWSDMIILRQHLWRHQRGQLLWDLKCCRLFYCPLLILCPGLQGVAFLKEIDENASSMQNIQSTWGHVKDFFTEYPPLELSPLSTQDNLLLVPFSLAFKFCMPPYWGLKPSLWHSNHQLCNHHAEH